MGSPPSDWPHSGQNRPEGTSRWQLGQRGTAGCYRPGFGRGIMESAPPLGGSPFRLRTGGSPPGPPSRVRSTPLERPRGISLLEVDMSAEVPWPRSRGSRLQPVPTPPAWIAADGSESRSIRVWRQGNRV